MALTLSNISSVRAGFDLGRSSRSLERTMGRVSSGLRINRAGDDAAGLAVAEGLSARSRSMAVARRNTNDGISITETADGATGEVANIVKRMRELAVQASSETLDDTERGYINDEFQSLATEVDRIAAGTEFNGTALTNGGTTQMAVQVGIDNTAADRITLTLGDVRSTVLGIDTGSIDMSTATGAQAALDTLDTALDTVSGYRASYGASQNRMSSALSFAETYETSLIAAESTIRDADFAYETAQMAKQQIMQQAGVAVLAQANVMNQGILSLV